ncbi:MAG: STAS domain-containing protein [Actinobacteria bacterium]|nr:STAS domain-containing protein [Actinomycetota bacterium]
MPDFEVRSARVGEGVYVVSVTGETDLHTAPDLERELQGVLVHGGTAVAVDLSHVDFIDSTTLSLLLRFQPRFRAREGDLVIVSEDRRVLRTLEITGLDRIFRIERRLADAVSELLSRVQAAGAAGTV